MSKKIELPNAMSPGQFIIDELEARGNQPGVFVETIGLSPEEGTALFDGELAIDEELAVKIGAFFGMGPEMWLNLERAYRTDVHESASATRMPNVRKPRKTTPKGAISLRVPASIHERLLQAAEHEGVSLNQFLLAVISSGLPTFETRRHYMVYVERGGAESFQNYYTSIEAARQAAYVWMKSLPDPHAARGFIFDDRVSGFVEDFNFETLRNFFERVQAAG